MGLGEGVAKGAPLALRYTKAGVKFGQTPSLDGNISRKAKFEGIFNDSGEGKNAVISFFNKQKPQWKGQ